MQATAPLRCNHARLQPSERFGLSVGYQVFAPCLCDATHFHDSVWDFSAVRYLYCDACVTSEPRAKPLADAPALPRPLLARG